jgi:ComF family protein
MGNMMKALANLLNLFFPNLCRLCKKQLVEGEEQLCLECLYHLPHTRFHARPDNPVVYLMADKEKLSHASAYLYYYKGSKTQELIHSIKYHDNKELGYLLGRYAARELHTAGNPLCEAGIILPVPLHPRKEKQRGYNQSEWIANGLSSILHIPVNHTLLVRTVTTESQTRKAVYERWLNVKEAFSVTCPEELAGKHVLLVDDVITTGATVGACIDVLSVIPGIRISLFALAIAKG